MENEIKLKLCPFCGSEAMVRRVRSMEVYRVTCVNEKCSATNMTWSYTQKEAAERWNRRVIGEKRN